MLIFVTIGKHIFCLQDVTLQQYYSQPVLFHEYIFLFCHLNYYGHIMKLSMSGEKVLNRISQIFCKKKLCSISVPFTKQQVDCLFQNNLSWEIAITLLTRQINNHFPADRFLQFSQLYSFIFPKIVNENTLEVARLVFPDGSSIGRAVYFKMVKNM